MKKIHIKWLQT